MLSSKVFDLFSVRERAEFNKSCNLIQPRSHGLFRILDREKALGTRLNLIGSWSERNFLIPIALAGGIHFRERINGYRQSFALSTPP